MVTQIPIEMEALSASYKAFLNKDDQIGSAQFRQADAILQEKGLSGIINGICYQICKLSGFPGYTGDFGKEALTGELYKPVESAIKAEAIRKVVIKYASKIPSPDTQKAIYQAFVDPSATDTTSSKTMKIVQTPLMNSTSGNFIKSARDFHNNITMSLTCPITKTTLEEAVIDPCGHTYSEASLREILKQNPPICSVTNQPMPSSIITPYYDYDAATTSSEHADSESSPTPALKKDPPIRSVTNRSMPSSTHTPYYSDSETSPTTALKENPPICSVTDELTPNYTARFLVEVFTEIPNPLTDLMTYAENLERQNQTLRQENSDLKQNSSRYALTTSPDLHYGATRVYTLAMESSNKAVDVLERNLQEKNRSIERLELQIDTMTKDHQLQIEAMRKDHRETMKRIEDVNKCTMTALKQCSEGFEHIKEAHEQAIGGLTQLAATTEAHRKEEIDRLTALHRETRESLNTQLINAQTQRNQDVARLTTLNTQVTTTLNSQLLATRTQRQDELARLTAAHEQVREGLNGRLQSLEDITQRRVTDLCQAHTQAVQVLQETLTSRQREKDTIERKHTLTLSRIRSLSFDGKAQLIFNPEGAIRRLTEES